MVSQVELILNCYHTLFPGLISICLVWVPLMLLGAYSVPTWTVPEPPEYKGCILYKYNYSTILLPSLV